MAELRWYQRAAIDTLYQSLAEHDDNPCAVLPTGAGKSVVMAALIHEALTHWPGTRIAVLAHVKELVAQNADKLARYWPDMPMGTMGVYSAGLQQRDTESAVIFASIQSVHKRAMELGRFDLILVDEAHRIPLSGDGMYRGFLEDARRANPHVRVIGLTATPYRLGPGMVVGPDFILNRICFEVGVRDLIEQSYLCPLISKGGQSRPDLSGVHVRGGEYVATEMEAAVDQDNLVQAAVIEMVDLCQDRRAWIVFCASVDHAEHVSRALADRGIRAPVISERTPAVERDQLIAAYQRREIRALCNVNVLSEGFDAQHIDAVIMLRPTKSPGLYYQQVGRGLRLHPDKKDCLVLDFAGNILEHGPVDAIQVKSKRPGSGSNGDTDRMPPARECPECHWIGHPSIKACPECWYEWPTSAAHMASAIDAPILSQGDSKPPPNRYEITDVVYCRHEKEGKPPSLRVEYYAGYRRIASEWVCLEHTGWPRQKAEQWWEKRDRTGFVPAPPSVDEALEYYDQDRDMLQDPSAILVDESGRWPEIVGFEWDEKPKPEKETSEVNWDDVDDVPF